MSSYKSKKSSKRIFIKILGLFVCYLLLLLLLKIIGIIFHLFHMVWTASPKEYLSTTLSGKRRWWSQNDTQNVLICSNDPCFLELSLEREKSDSTYSESGRNQTALSVYFSLCLLLGHLPWHMGKWHHGEFASTSKTEGIWKPLIQVPVCHLKPHTLPNCPNWVEFFCLHGSHCSRQPGQSMHCFRFWA